MSMDSKKPIIVKRSNLSNQKTQQRSNESTEKTQRRFQPLPQSAAEPVEPREIEQPEQPEPVIQLQSLAEPPIDQSIYGSGWSVAQLMTEFSWRYDDKI